MSSDSLEGREIHAVPASSKKSKLNIINREELENTSSSSQVAENQAAENTATDNQAAENQATSPSATTIVSPKPVNEETQKPKLCPVIDTPDTTVLGMESISGSLGMEDKSEDDGTDILDETKVKEKPESSKEDSINTDTQGENKISDKNDDIANNNNENTDDEIIKKDNKENESTPEETSPNSQPDEADVVAKDSIPSKEVASDSDDNDAKFKFFIERVSNGERIPINTDNFVVGKSKHSDYQVKGNNTISRSHVVISINKEKNALSLTDKNSKNGTSVDGIYLKADDTVELKHGSKIRLSDEEFKLLVIES